LRPLDRRATSQHSCSCRGGTTMVLPLISVEQNKNLWQKGLDSGITKLPVGQNAASAAWMPCAN
jgi:hypothetical protein